VKRPPQNGKKEIFICLIWAWYPEYMELSNKKTTHLKAGKGVQ
jgi:hypothetical protein